MNLYISYKVGHHIGKWQTIYINLISYSYTWVKLKWSPPFKLECKVDSLLVPNGGSFKMITLYNNMSIWWIINPRLLLSQIYAQSICCNVISSQGMLH